MTSDRGVSLLPPSFRTLEQPDPVRSPVTGPKDSSEGHGAVLDGVSE